MLNQRQSPAILHDVMQADRFRLQKAWQRLQSAQDADASRLADWQTRAEASAALRQRRADLVPAVAFDPELPITAHSEEIVSLIRTRQTIVVCGETGSGKSTQLPKLCLQAGLGIGAMIGHTQPRRLAARAVSSRLAEELGSRVGDLVGFKIRFTDATKPETLVKLMTDGVLLAETQSDRFLDQYDALIIDEAHERSLNIDFLIGYLRQLSGRRPDLKLIITSATIDPERFADHFADEHGPAPIVEVSGRTYAVEMRYRPINDVDDSPVAEERLLIAIASAADELISEGPGDILVFLPTERDIRETSKYLRGHYTRVGGQIEILPLYARLSQTEQNKIFSAHAGRRIVLATNVAESSLTVPGIRYVIDTGLVRISRYAPRSKIQRLPIEGVSQASANQRSGRCGRLGPGICIRLFSQDDYTSRGRFTTPEIRRSDLAAVLLQSKTLRLGSLSEFPLLDPPGSESLRDAERTLRELAAIDERGSLTAIGRQLGKLPCEPRVGRMLLEASERNCLAEVIIIAAGLETQDVRQRPAGQRPQADEAHAMFADPHSDFLTYLRLWDFYDRLRSDLGRARLQRALNQRFLSYPGFREWADIVRQLRELLLSAGVKAGSRRYHLPPIDLQAVEENDDKSGSPQGKKLQRPGGYESIHQALLTGLLSGIAQRGDRHEYKGPGGLSFSLWPGSGLFRRQPKWIIAAEIVETNKRYGRTVAEVDVEWIEQAGAALLKHSYSDPLWSSKTGTAMVHRRSTLYGLTIVSGRRVQLAPIDSQVARDMLIEQGLVAGEWHCQEAFYKHNQEMLADMHELAQRTRSRDYILDRFHIAAFYNSRIPADIYDLPTLIAWVRKHKGQHEERSLWMQPEDLLHTQEQSVSLEKDFPNTLRVGATELPLAYHFEPGHAADGVTVTVPQAALRQISPDTLGWLVPGLLEEKLLYVIRSLPKSLRINFLPAPDVAKKLAEKLAQFSHERPFAVALSEVMSQHAGQQITPNQLELDKLPGHLQFRVRVVNDEGDLISSGRNVDSLQTELALPASALETLSSTANAHGAKRAVTPSDFEELPEQIVIRWAGVLVAAFPTLIDTGGGVELGLSDTQAESERLSKRGTTRLFWLQHNRSLKSQVAHLPGLSACGVKLGHAVSSKELAGQLGDLIARIAFVEGRPPLRTREDFENRNVQATAGISIAAQELASWLPRMAEESHQVRLLIEKTPTVWEEVLDDIRSQLQNLFTADFLRDTPWSWLAEYPRYLQAIRQRFDKLKSGGLPKDRKLCEPIIAAWKGYQALVNAPSSRSSLSAERAHKLEDLRWMIEELRVSIYAQQLGTKISVSPKRVESAIKLLA